MHRLLLWSGVGIPEAGNIRGVPLELPHPPSVLSDKINALGRLTKLQPLASRSRSVRGNMPRRQQLPDVMRKGLGFHPQGRGSISSLKDAVSQTIRPLG